MIVIRVEMWPGGDRARAYPLGSAHIINDGTGTRTRGNYIVKLFGKQDRPLEPAGAVARFPRAAMHVWDLIYCCLRATRGRRNGD